MNIKGPQRGQGLVTFFERHSLAHNIVADSNHANASRAVRGAHALQSLRVASPSLPPQRAAPAAARSRSGLSVCRHGVRVRWRFNPHTERRDRALERSVRAPCAPAAHSRSPAARQRASAWEWSVGPGTARPRPVGSAQQAQPCRRRRCCAAALPLPLSRGPPCRACLGHAPSHPLGPPGCGGSGGKPSGRSPQQQQHQQQQQQLLLRLAAGSLLERAAAACARPRALRAWPPPAAAAGASGAGRMRLRRWAGWSSACCCCGARWRRVALRERPPATAVASSTAGSGAAAVSGLVVRLVAAPFDGARALPPRRAAEPDSLAGRGDGGPADHPDTPRRLGRPARCSGMATGAGIAQQHCRVLLQRCSGGIVASPGGPACLFLRKMKGLVTI